MNGYPEKIKSLHFSLEVTFIKKDKLNLKSLSLV
jgi:hypothetical protein